MDEEDEEVAWHVVTVKSIVMMEEEEEEEVLVGHPLRGPRCNGSVAAASGYRCDQHE